MASKTDLLRTQRFELVDVWSNKFWEITLHGTSVAVRSGRVGTMGRREVTVHTSPEAARAHHDQLVAAKLLRGYRRVTVGT